VSVALVETEPAWLTPQQTAARLQIHVQTVYKGCKDGELRHIGGGRQGARIRIRPAWADHWWATRLRRVDF
jgi:excisionase family DNA binding protein